MNREEIIKLAREAEFPAAKYPTLVSDKDWEALERFAALVAAAEREACEKVCSDLHIEGENNTGLAAEIIRARGQA